MLDPVFRLRVWYAGRVQGVGFRYKVARLAQGFEVTGYVQNLADGRVLLVAEGERPEVEAFVAEVGRMLDVFIRGTEVRQEEGARSCQGFVIRP